MLVNKSEIFIMDIIYRKRLLFNSKFGTVYSFFSIMLKKISLCEIKLTIMLFVLRVRVCGLFVLQRSNSVFFAYSLPSNEYFVPESFQHFFVVFNTFNNFGAVFNTFNTFNSANFCSGALP